MLAKIPKIDDLYQQKELAQKSNALNIILNCEPKKDWVKEHPMAKGVSYMPIEIVEYLLTNIFLKWRVEILKSEIMANSVVITVRLHIKDPVTGEWDYQDGIGAAPIQTDKGAAATDFTKVKTDAVMKAAPAAESFAIKDAAEKLGKLFGKDLNRKNGMEYSGLRERELNKVDLSNFSA